MTTGHTKAFRSSMTFAPEEVSDVLSRKIAEENEIAQASSSSADMELEEELLAQLEGKYDPQQVNILSLFSGAGGLDLGVKLAGAAVINGRETAYSAFDDRTKFENLASGINFVYSNDLFEAANISYIQNVAPDVVKDSRDIRKVVHFPKSDLILGGFPCPGFSSAGPRLLDDPRNFLYIHYIRAITQSQPKFFIAENVKGLMTMARGQVLEQIIEDFTACGYQVQAKLTNARDYGVPQLRERVFIIGVRNDIIESQNYTYEYPKPTHGANTGVPYVTLRDTIKDLEEDPDQEVFETSYSSIYMSRNRKKSWDEQSFTIQASGRQAPQHPGGEPMKKLGKDEWAFQGDKNRRLSVRESARIQTFPDWFEFSDGHKKERNNQLNEKYKQIGNAVPVFLAEKISEPIISYLIQSLPQH